MTEDQIERRVEKMIDALDAEFMAGKIDQDEYERRERGITDWADEQHSLLIRSKQVRG